MSMSPSFEQLNVAPLILQELVKLGYEAPTPIQAESIPVLMSGSDLLAQAQTGTGKTAAFALPILSNVDVELKQPQALIITPTRELAIQVAEAFQSYAKNLKGFHVAPIYGGQGYHLQLRALERGTQVIVGTPGRVMDHLRRGTLSVNSLKTLVLDEADEMLKMGFVDDVEWILEQIPTEHQTALFSATMPTSIQNISKRYLKDAVKIQIKSTEKTIDTIEQCYTLITAHQKMDLLTRFLEVEDMQASIIFTRTKNTSSELAEKLQARGYTAAALNGDMNQSAREKVIERIKRGSLDIIVATDVAARGIDVDRITHVINYDIPYDTEAYIHRIGRTGRAGRQGKALLFVTPREQRLLRDIERATHKPIIKIPPPSLQEMSDKRGQQLAEKVMRIIQNSKHLAPSKALVDQMIEASGCEIKDIAAALIYMSQESNPLPRAEIDMTSPKKIKRREKAASGRRDDRKRSFSRGSEGGLDRRDRGDRRDRSSDRGERKRSYSKATGDGFERKRSYTKRTEAGSSDRRGRDECSDRTDRKRSYSKDSGKSASSHKRQVFPKDLGTPNKKRRVFED